MPYNFPNKSVHYRKIEPKKDPLDSMNLMFGSRYVLETAASQKSGLMGYFRVERGSPFLGIGLSPHQNHPLAHTVLSADFIEVAQTLMIDSRFRIDGLLMVIDSSAVFNSFRQSNIPHPVSLFKAERPQDWLRDLGVEVDKFETPMLDILEADFNEMLCSSRQSVINEGGKVRVIIQSILENYVRNHYAQIRKATDFDDRRIVPPVVQLSDIMKNGCIPGAENANKDILAIFSALFELIEQEDGLGDELADAIWKSIPYPIRRKDFGSKAGRSYSGLKKEGLKKQAREMMGYVLMQIALVLYWGGEKYGYEGEREFDEVTKLARDQFSAEIGLDTHSLGGKFTYLKMSNQTKVPYRYHNFPDETPLPRPDFEVLGLFSASEEGALEDRIAHMAEHYFPILEIKLKRISSPSDLGKKTDLAHRGAIFLELELFKHLRELVAELNSDSDLKEVLEASGINAVTLGTMPIFDLPKIKARDLPLKVKDLNRTTDEKILNGQDERMVKALEDLSDAGLNPQKLAEVMADGFQEKLILDRINYARLLRNDRGIIPSATPKSPHDYEYFYHAGLLSSDRDQFIAQFIEGMPISYVLRFKYDLIHQLESRIAGRIENSENLFENKEAYLIRYLAEVLSGPVSKNLKLACLLNDLLRRLSKILLPGYELCIDLSTPHWPYDQWKKDQDAKKR